MNRLTMHASGRRRPRGAVAGLAVAVVTGSLFLGHTVHADTLATFTTAGGAVCTQGDTTLPTILALRVGSDTTGLPQSAVDLLSSVHPGSVCTWSVSFVSPNIDTPSGAPTGWGVGAGCQTTPCNFTAYYGTDNFVDHDCGGALSGGCVAEFNQMQASFGIFSDGFYYDSGQSLDCQDTSSGTCANSWSWSNVSVNDNNSDGVSVTYGVSYHQGQPANTGGWWYSDAEQLGQADHEKKACTFGAFPVCIADLTGFRTHVGQKGTVTDSSSGATGTYCTAADFAPYLDQVTFGTGDCQNP